MYTERRKEVGMVITDMMMPVMDGATTIRELQKLNPDLKIVSISGLGSAAFNCERQRSSCGCLVEEAVCGGSAAQNDRTKCWNQVREK